MGKTTLVTFKVFYPILGTVNTSFRTFVSVGYANKHVNNEIGKFIRNINGNYTIINTENKVTIIRQDVPKNICTWTIEEDVPD